MEVTRKKRIYLRELDDLKLLVNVMKENDIEDIFAHFDEAICADVIVQDNGVKYVELTLEDWI
jgi:hypothetical protein